MRGQALVICLKALDQGTIPPERREEVLAFIESCPPDQTSPQILIEHGILTQEQLGALQAESTAAETLKDIPGAKAGIRPGQDRPSLPRSFGLRYELLEVVGEGAMGTVYKALHRHLRRHVAIKILKSAGTVGESFVPRFQREARAVARLYHPNIVSVHDVGEHDGQHFLMMDLVDGRSLNEVIRDGRLSLTQSLELLEKVARTVHYAHEQGIIHRDLKPGNILVDSDGEPLVTDFDLARDLETDFGLSLSHVALGTPSYMSPEQARGQSEEADARSDVYSLGAVLYEMLVGRPPFTAANIPELLRRVAEDDPVPPRRLNGAVPAEVETICLKCLSKEPGRRYPTAAALADDLRRCLHYELIVARLSSGTQRQAASAWERQDVRV